MTASRRAEKRGPDDSICVRAEGRGRGHHDCVGYRRTRHHGPLHATGCRSGPEALADLAICDCKGLLHPSAACAPSPALRLNWLATREFFTTKPVQLRLANTAIVSSTIMIVAKKARISAGMCGR